MSVVLACDLGGTSFRAALVDREGASVVKSIIGPTQIDRLGASEIDATEWWRTFLIACSELAEAAPALFDQVQGIAICGVTRTQVFLDRDGRQLRPAITWNDTRAEAASKRLASGSAAGHRELANVNAFHPVARLAWLREEEEASFRALAKVLEPKDYLNFRLTGRSAGDRVSMARIIASATPDAQGRDLLSAIGASTDLLPRILDPLERVGAVVPDLPKPLSRLAGVPVFCCSNDTWTGVAGLGALRPGLAYNISGTTEVLGVVSETSGFAEGLMSVDWCGVHQLGGPSQNGADTIAWLLDLFGQFNGGYASVGSGIDALLAGQRDPQPVVFLPYLQGERVPYWDASLRGAFVGLNRRHGATDLAWAVLEGIACLNRIVLDKAEAALGFTVSEIRFGGGAARNPTWQQLKADICRRPVVVGVSEQPGILGAAIVAWTGTGRFSSLAQAQERLVKVASRCEPDAIRGKAYALLFELYRRCEQALAPISHDLAGFARENGPLLGAPIAASRPGEEPSA